MARLKMNPSNVKSEPFDDLMSSLESYFYKTAGIIEEQNLGDNLELINAKTDIEGVSRELRRMERAGVNNAVELFHNGTIEGRLRDKWDNAKKVEDKKKPLDFLVYMSTASEETMIVMPVYSISENEVARTIHNTLNQYGFQMEAKYGLMLLPVINDFAAIKFTGSIYPDTSYTLGKKLKRHFVELQYKTGITLRISKYDFIPEFLKPEPQYDFIPLSKPEPPEEFEESAPKSLSGYLSWKIVEDLRYGSVHNFCQQTNILNMEETIDSIIKGDLPNIPTLIIPTLRKLEEHIGIEKSKLVNRLTGRLAMESLINNGFNRWEVMDVYNLTEERYWKFVGILNKGEYNKESRIIREHSKTSTHIPEITGQIASDSTVIRTN